MMPAKDDADVSAQTDPHHAREPIGGVRWAVFAVLVVVSFVWGTYTLTALTGGSLTNDLGAQYHLAKITAEGAVPLVDFQHGWNAGSWWVSSLIYRLVGGDATWWTYLVGRLFGVTMSGVLVAAIGLRHRAHPAAIAAMTLGVLAIAPPPQLKYALPVLFVFVLLPSRWLDCGWRGLVVRAVAPALLFWQHVELAILLTAAAVLFELVGRERASIRDRLQRAVALGLGVVIGLVSEAAVYGLGYGMSIGELNRQVGLGQMETFPIQFDWPFFDVPTDRVGYQIVALFPFLLLLLFLPVVWRRTTDQTRYVAFSALCLATTAIRRPGPGHAMAVSALLVCALVLTVDDVHRRRAPHHRPAQRTTLLSAATAVVGALCGMAWVGVALAFGFGAEGFSGPVVLVLTVVVAVVASRFLGPMVAASIGAVVVIAVVPLAAAVNRVDDLHDDGQPFARTEAFAAAIRPELERCLAGSDEAFVVANYLALYDELGIENPTPFYLFHYDFGRNEEQLTRELESGQVPVIVQVTGFPAEAWMVKAVESNYERCSEVHMEEPAKVIVLWAHRSRQPFEERIVTVAPDGTSTYRDRPPG